jgi:spindle assembly abnormal protein 6
LISQQNASTNQKEKVFRVEITDEDGPDPYFLYIWSVSEEEYHDLKQQQRLLIDFAKFPTNFMELLKCCINDDTKNVQQHKSKQEEDTFDKHVEDVDEEDAENIEPKQITAPISSSKPRSQGPVPLRYC